MSDTPREAQAREVHASEPLARGQVQWHCSEEGGGPDVGILVGLGCGQHLWLGEMLDAEGGGMGFIFYGDDCERVTASLSEWEDVREIIEHHVAPALAYADQPRPIETGEVLAADYSEQALADRQIDFLESRAAEWMEDTDVQRMFNAIASVFEKWAPQEIMDRFRTELGTIGRQCHVEGALRIWEEIAAQQRALGTPLPANAEDAAHRLAFASQGMPGSSREGEHDGDWWASTTGSQREELFVVLNGIQLGGDVSEIPDAIDRIIKVMRPTAPDAIRLRALYCFLGEAERVVNSDSVISVFAACEWDELHDDGKQWVAAIVREVLAANALSLVSPVETGWQPIDTAPKDGTEFQAWIDNRDDGGTAFWEPRCRINPDSEAFEIWGRVDYDCDGWDVYFEIRPTHWRPLPTPPAQGASNG